MSAALNHRLVHALRFVHAVNRTPLPVPFFRVEEPLWPGWSVTIRKQHLLLLVNEGFDLAEAGPVCLHLQVAEAGLADVLASKGQLRLVLSEAETEQPADPADEEAGTRALEESIPFRHLQVTRPDEPLRAEQTEVVVELEPAPMRLEVQLVDEDGDPRTRESVFVRGSEDSDRIELAPDPQRPGIYVSPWRIWDESLFPFRLYRSVQESGSSPERALATRRMDYENRVTRFRLVAPN